WKPADDHFGRADRQQRHAIHLKPYELCVRANVQVVVAPGDRRAAQPIAEPILPIEAAVAIGVAQGHDGGGTILRAELDVYVAVRCNRQVTTGTEVVRDNRGAESSRQRKAPMCGLA